MWWSGFSVISWQNLFCFNIHLLLHPPTMQQWKTWPHPVLLLLSNSGLLLGIQETPASPGWICATIHSLSSQGRCSNLLTTLELVVFAELAPICTCLSCICRKKGAASILIKSTECWAKGGYHFHWPTIYHSANSARLDFFAVRAYQMAHVPLLPIKITRLFSRKLHCRQHYYTGFLLPRTLCLSLLNFTHFLLAHFSRLLRSLWRAALPPGLLTHPPVWCHLQTLWSTISLPLPGHKDVKQDRSQVRPLQSSTFYCCPGRVWPINNSPLSPVIHQF